MEQHSFLKKVLISVVLILIACISIFFFARWASSNENFASIQTSIDQKAQRVLGMSASAAAVSTGLSFLPEDIGSPISQEIADLSGYFLLILCILYTEKNLLALIGAAVFKYVIPFVCCLLIGVQFLNSQQLRNFATKLLILSLAVYFMIPGSIVLSDAIYENHKEIIEITESEAQEINGDLDKLYENESSGNATGLLGKAKAAVSSAINKGGEILNRFIESIAVFIVTTCVIPILLLAFFLWLIDKFIGIKIEFPNARNWRKPFLNWREDE